MVGEFTLRTITLMANACLKDGRGDADQLLHLLRLGYCPELSDPGAGKMIVTVRDRDGRLVLFWGFGRLAWNSVWAIQIVGRRLDINDTLQLSRAIAVFICHKLCTAQNLNGQKRDNSDYDISSHTGWPKGRRTLAGLESMGDAVERI